MTNEEWFDISDEEIRRELKAMLDRFDAFANRVGSGGAMIVYYKTCRIIIEILKMGILQAYNGKESLEQAKAAAKEIAEEVISSRLLELAAMKEKA